MLILIHSSKTMRADAPAQAGLTTPVLLDRAVELVDYLRTLSLAQVERVMKVSPTLAAATRALHQGWSADPADQEPAAEAFLGDIYSGLQLAAWSRAERAYGQQNIRILSGLYGILRPFDGIRPYRLELGYKLPDPRYTSLYRFWGGSVAGTLPTTGTILNLAAGEYSKVVLPHLNPDRVVSPRFLTLTNGVATFVAVHAKVARGAFARWLAGHPRASIEEFAELGYELDPHASTDREPVFTCAEFGGKGLSVRLS